MGRDPGMASSVASPAMWCNDILSGILCPPFGTRDELVVFLHGTAKIDDESSATCR